MIHGAIVFALFAVACWLIYRLECKCHRQALENHSLREQLGRACWAISRYEERHEATRPEGYRDH